MYYEEVEGNTVVDWYSGLELTYNENNRGKKQIKTYYYCDGEFEANNINGWELLKDEIEEKANKKGIKIKWNTDDNLWPARADGDEFYDFCYEILESHDGLEGLSTKITTKKISQISISKEQIQSIANKAGELGYYSLIDKIKKERI